MRKKKEESDYD